MTEPEARRVSTAAEMLDVGVDIESVQFFNLHAEVNEGVEAPNDEQEVSPTYGLKLRHEGNELGIRVSITIDLVGAKIVVDAAVNYVTAELLDMEEATFLDFANNVGVMALLPYLRQAIADLSQRVIGEVILMPIIPRGGLTFSSEDAVSPQ